MNAKSCSSFCCLMLICTSAAFAVVIETVPVRNAGNSDEHPFFNAAGGVDYEYKIGRCEVTNNQYTEFLNAVNPYDSIKIFTPKESSPASPPYLYRYYSDRLRRDKR